jgi:hypothetical protein
MQYVFFSCFDFNCLFEDLEIFLIAIVDEDNQMFFEFHYEQIHH